MTKPNLRKLVLETMLSSESKKEEDIATAVNASIASMSPEDERAAMAQLLSFAVSEVRDAYDGDLSQVQFDTDEEFAQTMTEWRDRRDQARR